MVSVFDGQLCRTWHYTSEEASIAPSTSPFFLLFLSSRLEHSVAHIWTHTDIGSSGSETGTNETARRHVINLFHDTLTGVRSALVDYEEVPDSLGTSALLMGSEGHRITFSLKPSGEQGYILVKRSGWIGFEYKCFIGNTQLSEATETVAKGQEDQAYSVDIIEYMSTPVNQTFISYISSYINAMPCNRIRYNITHCTLYMHAVSYYTVGWVVGTVHRMVRSQYNPSLWWCSYYCSSEV